MSLKMQQQMKIIFLISCNVWETRMNSFIDTKLYKQAEWRINKQDKYALSPLLSNAFYQN